MTHLAPTLGGSAAADESMPPAEGMKVDVNDSPVQQPSPPPPELVLPTAKSATEAVALLAGRLRGMLLLPKDLTAQRLAERMRLWYEPVWLLDLEVRGRWRAEGGADEPFVAVDDTLREGTWSSQARVASRTHWHALTGELHRRYPNVPTQALLEPTTLSSLDPELALADAVAWSDARTTDSSWCLPDIPLEEATTAALAVARGRAAEECRQAAGADRLRNFEWDVEDSRRQTATLLLVPAWSTYYADDNGERRVIHVSAIGSDMAGELVRSHRARLALLGAVMVSATFIVALSILIHQTGWLEFVVVLIGAWIAGLWAVLVLLQHGSAQQLGSGRVPGARP